MAFCTKCGHYLGPWDNYCSNCGKRVSGSGSDYTFPGLSTKSDFKPRGKNCPRCGGSGQCSMTRNMNSGLALLLSLSSGGIFLIGTSLAKEKCKRCNGTGRVPRGEQ